MTAHAPWLQRKDWATGRVASNARANLRTAWTFTVLWNLVSAPILVFIPRELARKPIAAIGFIFPVAGVGLLAWALLLTLRWRRFGPASFELTPLPAVPGGILNGTIRTKLERPSLTQPFVVSVRLSCLQRTVSRGSESRDVRETILWREEQDVSADRIAFTPMGTSIPVRFSLPPDALETTTIDQGAGILWSLDANAQLPGVDLCEEFDIPVYRGADAVPSTSAPVIPLATVRSEPVTPDRLAQAGIEIRRTPDGAEYRFRASRNQSFSIGVTAFTLLWTGAIWLQWYLGFPWFFVVVTALVDLLLLVVLSDLWFGSTTVITSPGSIRRRHSLFGMGGWRTIAASEIAALKLHISMQTTGRAGTPYYEIRAMLKSGRRCALGDGIRNKRQAEWLLEQMQKESFFT